jgi:molybdenum cofactor cytidylyltransferase
LTTLRRIDAVVLAAGASRRMGVPKQLLRVEGVSLVRRAALAALASRARSVFVVLGCEAEAVAGELRDLAVTALRHADWARGLGSSIRAGVEAAARADPPGDAVLLLLADQPRVCGATLDRLIDAFEATGRSIVACTYAGTAGAPALFARRHFPALLSLEGDRGAKAVIEAQPGDVEHIACDEAAIDLDSPDDLPGPPWLRSAP